MSRYRVSMDIGGTFTDVVAYDEESGTYTAGKSSTTTQDLTEGVFAALGAVVDTPADIGFTVHGTTQGLNAFLQRRGEKVLLLATKGCGRRLPHRPRQPHAPVRHPLPQADAARRAQRHRRDPRPPELGGRGAGATRRGRRSRRGAACAGGRVRRRRRRVPVLLREPRARASRRGDPARGVDGVAVSLSHRVAREWREYERTSSAVIDAYTAPVVRRYLARLESELTRRGLSRAAARDAVHRRHRDAPSRRATSRCRRCSPGPVGGTMGGVALARAARPSQPDLRRHGRHELRRQPRRRRQARRRRRRRHSRDFRC